MRVYLCMFVFSKNADDVCGVLVQYPNTNGAVVDYGDLAARTHTTGALFIVASDLLALTLLKPPGEFGADVCLGSTQVNMK